MKAINTEKAPAAIGPYSQAIEANGFIFASGQLPIDPATGCFPEGGIKEQTRQSLTNAKNILVTIDAVIDFKDISKRLYNDLKRFSPFGPGNTKPVFCTMAVYDYGTSKVVGREQEHIKLELVDSKSSTVVNGIAFGQSASARYIKSKRSFDIVYTIEDNIFKKNQVQLQIEDIRPNCDN